MKNTPRSVISWGKGSKPTRFTLLIVGLLCLATVGTAGIQPLAQTHAPAVPANVQPILAQMATDQPDSLVSVIVQKSVKDRSLEEMVAHLGGTVTTDLSIINAFAAEMKAEDVPQLALANGVRWVSFDAPMVEAGGPDSSVDTGNLINVYDSAVGADRVWAEGYQGSGVTVAVVDSGMNYADDFRTNYSSKGSYRIIAQQRFASGPQYPTDRYGHGSHIGGIIGGNGYPDGGMYIGIAPKVNFVNLKVSDDQGASSASNVVAALQWVYNNESTYNIRVVNLSLNSSVYQSYNLDPIDAASEILWFNGIVVVTSAGNNATATLYPPANDPFVITVGATDDRGTASISDDVTASFSAYGVTASGFAKPDLVAPGKNIVSVLSMQSSVLAQAHPANVVDSNYFRMSGTSMAAPMVAGGAAILLQSNPNLNPDQVKYRLMATANKSWPGYNATTAGAGYLDIFAAVHGTTTESANTGNPISSLLFTGSNPTWTSANWNSVDWNSANWNSVDWNSANWNSANWNSANWNSDYWGQ